MISWKHVKEKLFLCNQRHVRIWKKNPFWFIFVRYKSLSFPVVFYSVASITINMIMDYCHKKYQTKVSIFENMDTFVCAVVFFETIVITALITGLIGDISQT